MENPATDARHEVARRHVRAVRGFYTHALVFFLVNGALITAYYGFGAGRGNWVGWPLGGWSIGLLAHGVSVFVLGGWLGPDWEERRIREYLDRHP